MSASAADDAGIRPLQGVRVLDLGQFIAGPCTSVLLAEMGAEVIKVEPPAGDAFRGFDDGLYSASFVAFNRGKKSITLDLKNDQDKQTLLDLARDADVVVENYRPGVTERLGVSYEHLREVNPQLIYCTITGFGSTGPSSLKPSFDGVALGYSGLAHLLLDPSSPRLVGPAIADAITGHAAAFNILAALWERQRSARGHHIEVSMLGALVHFLHSPVSKSIMGKEEGPFTRTYGSQAYVFVASDERLLLIHMSSPQKFWHALCAAIDRPDLAEDERFAKHSARKRNYEVLREILQAVFAERDRDTWLRALQDAEVPCAPVNTIGEALRDEQLQHLSLFGTTEDATVGIVPDLRPPAHWNGRPLPPIDRAPLVGEHNDEIIATVRGVAGAEVQR